jgi:hypothetical protein
VGSVRRVPDDPLRRLVVPTEDELAPWGALDPCDEAGYNYGRVVIAARDEEACWLDELTLVSGTRSAIEAAAAFAPLGR